MTIFLMILKFIYIPFLKKVIQNFHKDKNNNNHNKNNYDKNNDSNHNND